MKSSTLLSALQKIQKIMCYWVLCANPIDGLLSLPTVHTWLLANEYGSVVVAKSRISTVPVCTSIPVIRPLREFSPANDMSANSTGTVMWIDTSEGGSAGSPTAPNAGVSRSLQVKNFIPFGGSSSRCSVRHCSNIPIAQNDSRSKRANACLRQL